MDEAALQGLAPQADPTQQARALQYFERLKNEPNSWQLCINTLTSGSCRDDYVKFFCFQILENFVKTRYGECDSSQQRYLRDFLSQWVMMQCCSTSEDKVFLKNKVAQVFSLVFVTDYPTRWPTFFTDLLGTLSLGPQACDLYIRVLLAIDVEVVERQYTHISQESERNTRIKDTMRDQCIPDLVDSWHMIITTYEKSHPHLTCECLEVIGAYVEWIDINLVANDRFVSVLVRFLKDPLLRESACDCVHEVISKGMDPMAKTKLVESFVEVLNSAKIWESGDDDDSDFLIKLSKLVNGIGTSLIASWQKVVKTGGDMGQVQAVLRSVEAKVPLMLRFLSNDCDDVSAAVTEFTREYIQVLKQMPTRNEVHQEHIENLIYIVMQKFKYDESYNFDHEGEDEAIFLEYRRQLKVVFDNLAQLSKDTVMSRVQEKVSVTLQNWRSLPFEETEAAITFLYMLGEAIPASHTANFTSEEGKILPMQQMMRVVVSSGVNCHTHVAVSLQYFETIVRYEKFFTYEAQHVPDALIAFLDNRGLRHTSPKVRSRTAYLFSRFIKCLKSLIQPYTEDVLKRLEELLILAIPNNGLQITAALITTDDQLYLYETAAGLIVGGQFEPEKKHMLMKNLLTPVLSKFGLLLERLAVERDENKQAQLAECMAHAMAVTSRTSKAFSNQQTIKTCNCVQLYLDALQVFMRALHVPQHRQILQSGLRQFLHRMVVCLEEELLPYIPAAAEGLLKDTTDIRSIQEFIPLINQIITKFKLSWLFQKDVVPFLQRVFMPLVSTMFTVLTSPTDAADEQATRDKQQLQRGYYMFIAAIITNNVTEVIASQDVQNMEQVLVTVIHGAVDFPDPVAQKTCFSILKKLVEVWGEKDGPTGFEQFMYKNIVPACFMAPLKPTFDLADAQTILALSESALCMKAILEKRGDELVQYLRTQYLPTLNVSPQYIDEYCHALNSDMKSYKTYVKLFFQRAKS